LRFEQSQLREKCLLTVSHCQCELRATMLMAISGPINNGTLGSLSPNITDLSVTDTDKTRIELGVVVSVTNPTNYSAIVPYANVQLFNNGTLLGNATASNLSVKPGRNNGLSISAVWDPVALSGQNGSLVARTFLSDFISGERLVCQVYCVLLIFRPQHQSYCSHSCKVVSQHTHSGTSAIEVRV
jgi:hypothetical protein